MHILENIPLREYSTMRLGGSAAYLTEVSTKQEVSEVIRWAEEQGLPAMLIGSGSNIIWDDDGYPGVVMVNKLMGVEINSQVDDITYITAASGENWDDFVAHTVSQGLTGLEFLSLIPGTVGATPVQNVGAYGAEVAQTISTIEAYDTQTNSFVMLRGSECEFAYRDSRFKKQDRGRFFITSVTFMLQKANPMPPFYGALQTYLDEHNIQNVTPSAVREAIIVIRSAKLPDPALVANNGSFFANPVIDAVRFFELRTDYPDIPHWNTDNDKVKLSAAWLLEQTGFKDFHDDETGMATWPKQPLVLVNEHAPNTAALKIFKAKIVNAVKAKFNIDLVQEPELI